MPFTQTNRTATVTSPLGKDVLLFYRMTGTEQISRLFEYQIDVLSEKNDIDLKKLLGKGMTIKLELGNDKYRYFNGIVTRFSQYGSLGDLICYRAILHPKPWLLTRASDCRIMETGKTVPDIVKKILGDHGYSDIEMHLGSSYSYTPREYCVQYRETDFNFISRLLEEEGIHYFFKHEDGKHTMVFCDSITGHEKAKGHESGVPYFPPNNEKRREKQHLYEWNLSQGIQTGLYDITDYDFEKPNANLHVKSSIPGQHAEANKEFYDYPGDYTDTGDGNHYVTSRMEELRSEYERIQCSGNTRGVAVGSLFKLVDYPRSDQNREYLTIASTVQILNDEYVSVEGAAVEEYQCNYFVMDSQIAFRPPRITPKPIVQGPQTAVVVGKQGEEIFTDKYGRVKVQFHWDRLGKKDEKSSCWVRVSQVWAGKQWGAIHIPRIGQEVIVDFLEGDPDRPIITGRVYNANQMPPYSLPDNKTQSGIKSRSSKGGAAANFNEIRFEDKKGAEQIVVHAERNMDEYVENDFMGQVDGNKHLKVKKDQTEKIEGNMLLTVGKGSNSSGGNMDIVIEKNKKELIEANSHLHIKGARKEKVDTDQSLTVGMNQQEKVGTKHALEAGQEIHLKAGMKVIIEAGLQLTIKGAGGFVDIGPAGVTIQGTLVNINSGGAAGSGGGSSPEAPEEATEAKPTEPTPVASNN